jgi:hypothetical protein
MNRLRQLKSFYYFLPLICLLGNSCGKTKTPPTCENGLSYEHYPSCKCPEGQYQVDNSWACRVVYDMKDPYAANSVFIVGNIPEGFFKGHSRSLYFDFYGNSSLYRSPWGDSNNVVLGFIENGTSIKKLSPIILMAYHAPVSNPETYNFKIDLRQLSNGLGYNDSGQSLVLTGTFTEGAYSKPVDDWKWHVIANGDTSLTPIRSYPASINNQ